MLFCASNVRILPFIYVDYVSLIDKIIDSNLKHIPEGWYIEFNGDQFRGVYIGKWKDVKCSPYSKDYDPLGKHDPT